MPLVKIGKHDSNQDEVVKSDAWPAERTSLRWQHELNMTLAREIDYRFIKLP